MKIWFYISLKLEFVVLIDYVIPIGFPISLAEARYGSDMFQCRFLRIKS